MRLPWVRPILDEELNRLPERLRQPFVLCYLEGKTNEEAARQLGCPPGTIFSRLARGREMLRQRLLRRGVALSTTVLMTTLVQHAAEAIPPTPLVATARRTALLYADGQATSGALSAEVTALTEGVLRTMFLSRLKMAALMLFVVVGLLAGGGTLLQRVLTAAPPVPERHEEPAAQAADERKDEPKKPIVQVVQPKPGGFARRIDLSGDVRPAAEQHVLAAVSGYLKRLPVGLGDRVKKGDLLAEIHAPLLQLEAKQANASVIVVEGLVAEAKARVATATAEYQAAKNLIAQRESEVKSTEASLAFTQKQSERIKQLSSSGAVGQTTLDEQQSRLLAAQVQHQKAQAAVISARSDIAVQESKIDSARAALESAKANVTIARLALEKADVQAGFTVLLANFDGVVTQVNFHVGDFIPARDSGPSRPLLTVQRTDLLRVVVLVPEWDALSTQPGVPVEVEGLKLPGAKVSRIGYALDEKTGAMPIEIEIPNPDNWLRPGMSLAVTLQFEKRPGVFTIPKEALTPEVIMVHQDRPPRRVIYVVRDGKAHKVLVQTGIQKADQVEILLSLQAMDRIVVNPKVLLPDSSDAIPVEVKKEP